MDLGEFGMRFGHDSATETRNIVTYWTNQRGHTASAEALVYEQVNSHILASVFAINTNNRISVSNLKLKRRAIDNG